MLSPLISPPFSCGRTSIARRTVPIRRGHLRPIMFRVNSQISRDKFALTSSLPPPSVVLSTCPPTTTMIKLKLLHAGRNVDSCRLNLQKSSTLDTLQRSTFDVRRSTRFTDEKFRGNRGLLCHFAFCEILIERRGESNENE